MLEQIELTQDHKDLLFNLGDGDLSSGLRILMDNHVSMNSPRIRKTVGTETARKYIVEYLEPTTDKTKVMKAGDIYNEYQNYSIGKPTVGRNVFYKVLAMFDFTVVTAGGNVRKVYGIQSNYL